MKLSIQLEMPQPQSAQPEQAQKPSIEERVREAVELCESGYCSSTEFLMLAKLAQALREKKQNPRIENLLQMIQPTLNKYGYHDLVPSEEE